MKVLILANADSGLYRFRLELIRALLERGHEVTIALPDGPYIGRLQSLGCRFVDTPIDRRGTNPVKELALLFTFRRIVRQVRPDAVLTYTIKPNIYGGLACRQLKVPYLANITGLGASIEKGGALRRVTLFLYRAALKKASCIFFQNQENLELMRRLKVVTAQKTRLIPGSGVNTDYYAALDYPPDGIIRFLFLGRVMAEKGIEHFIDAAECFKAQNAPVEFLILGGCEERYEKRLAELQARGVVVYHGQTEDVREFHKTSHCTIHPSYWEGMSNVLLESACCARPVITTNISGCREIVDDGVTGFLVPVQSSPALIEAVGRFLALGYDEKKQMGQRGRDKVLREFDRSLVVGAYLQELDSAAESCSRAGRRVEP